MTRLWSGRYGIRFATGAKGFFSSRASRPALELPQPPFPWARGSFPGVRPPGRDADHSRPSVEVRMSETIPLRSLCVFISCSGTALSYVLREGRTCSFCRVIFLWNVKQQYGGHLKYFSTFWYADFGTQMNI